MNQSEENLSPVGAVKISLNKFGPPDMVKYLASYGFESAINGDSVVVQDPVCRIVPQSKNLRFDSMKPVTIKSFNEAIRFVNIRS